MRRPLRSSLISCLPALLAVACQDPAVEFTPASFIEKLRVIGVRAEPPEIAPGESTVLDALVADPLPTPRPVSYIWVICVPDPRSEATLPCATQDAARDPAALLEDPNVTLLPFLATPTWTAPATLFDALPDDAIERRRGVDVAALLLVFEGSDIEAVKRREVEVQVALKSIRVKDAAYRSNTNPTLTAMRVDGNVLENEAIPTLAPDSTLQLVADRDPAGEEAFERVTATGSTEPATEVSIFSWYTDGGAFVAQDGIPARTVGPIPVPLQLPVAIGEVHLWVVLRDGRGGIDWMRRTVRVGGL